MLKDSDTMRPISNDKRKNIIEAKQRGESLENIIKWFCVSKATINRIYKIYKDTGNYEPVAYTGRRSSFTEEMNTKIRTIVKNTPDITLQEIIDKLKLKVTVSGLSRHMETIGLTFKKRRSMLRDSKEKMLSKEEQHLRKNKTS